MFPNPTTVTFWRSPHTLCTIMISNATDTNFAFHLHKHSTVYLYHASFYTLPTHTIYQTHCSVKHILISPTATTHKDDYAKHTTGKFWLMLIKWTDRNCKMLGETQHTVFWNVQWHWLAVCYQLQTRITQHHNRLKTSSCTVPESRNIATD
jgi:hypothetical protein